MRAPASSTSAIRKSSQRLSLVGDSAPVLAGEDVFRTVDRGPLAVGSGEEPPFEGFPLLDLALPVGGLGARLPVLRARLFPVGWIERVAGACRAPGALLAGPNDVAARPGPHLDQARALSAETRISLTHSSTSEPSPPDTTSAPTITSPESSSLRQGSGCGLMSRRPSRTGPNHPQAQAPARHLG
jgi:hypothetical protein